MNRHLPRIDALRGLLALTVLAYHAANPFEGLHGFANGLGAVVAFFVISGFVLSRSLAANGDPVRFFRNRFLRLFPAGAMSVLLLTALYLSTGFYNGYLPSHDPLNVLLNMLIIKSDINPAMWSLTVECFATPVILVSFLLAMRFGAAPIYAAIIPLFALSFWGPYVHLLGGITNLAPLYAFLIGVLVHLQGERLVNRLSTVASIVGLVLAAAIFFLCGFKKQTAPILALEAMSAAVVIALAAYREMALLRFLDLRAIRFYGAISYSFYLLHGIGIGVAYLLPDMSRLPEVVGFLAYCLCSTAVATPIAYLSWRVFELPPMRLAKSLSRSTRPIQGGPIEVAG